MMISVVSATWHAKLFHSVLYRVLLANVRSSFFESSTYAFRSYLGKRFT